jgi:aconitate hydratase
VGEYLAASGLLKALEALRFHLVGFGCTTCIGNSGPLPDAVSRGIKEGELVVAAVLSGNRNFEGRIHPQVRAAYLASPPLVVAYALAGSMDIDLLQEPLGTSREGKPVYLRDIWPTQGEVRDHLQRVVTPELFRTKYAHVFEGDEAWGMLPTPKGDLYGWDEASTYIRRPPYFDGMKLDPTPPQDLRGARALAVLGDSVTTDHISPAGDIAADSPAGRYLIERHTAKEGFNSYGSRRGNHEVMMRGTFANVRLKNLLVPGTEGGVTLHLPAGKTMSIYEASTLYQRENIPLIVIAGKEYGSGSSRDWAAKGPGLLGIRATLAESYERIHRSNLIGMGILPLQFEAGQNRETLGLTGREVFDIEGVSGGVPPKKKMKVRARAEDGGVKEFTAVARIDTQVETEYYRHGGILPYVLRQLVVAAKTP